MSEMTLTAQQVIKDAAGQLRVHGDFGMASLLESTVRGLVAEVCADERERCARSIDSALSEVVIVGAAKGAGWATVTVQISRLLAAIAAAIRMQSEGENR